MCGCCADAGQLFLTGQRGTVWLEADGSFLGHAAQDDFDGLAFFVGEGAELFDDAPVDGVGVGAQEIVDGDVEECGNPWQPFDAWK